MRVRVQRPGGPAEGLTHPRHPRSDPRAVLRAPLIAHLGNDPKFPGQLAQQSRFVNGLHQRLLAIDMFAHPDRRRRHHGMHVIGRGDDNCIESFLLFQHLAPVLIPAGVRVFLLPTGKSARVHIARRHDVFVGAVVRVAGAFAARAADPDAKLFVCRELARRNRSGAPRPRGRWCEEIDDA